MQMLADGLFLDCLDHPRLIAAVYDNRVIDLWAEQDSGERLGAVHLARVTGRFAQHNRLTGQLSSGASVSWPIKGKAKITEGQLVPVTLTAAARQDKPVQAVGGIELAGRLSVLRWQGEKQGQVYLSRKAGKLRSHDDQITKLTQLCQHTGVLEAGFDVVIRRSALAQGQQLDEAVSALIRDEVTGLLAGWSEQADKPGELSGQAQARLIYPGPSLHRRLKFLYPELPVRQLGENDWQIVHAAYDAAVQPRYESRQGAVFWIEQTRAAVMVDIDSAASKLAPDRLCQLILPELFTQISLRRLAGKILVDLPYIANDKRSAVLAEIDQLTRFDPRYPECFGFTRSGLLELSVRHGRPVLDKDHTLQAVMEQVARRGE